MTSRLAVLALAALSAASPAMAERTVLSGGNVIDVRSGEVMNGSSILVEDGRIAGIGSENSLGLDGSETILDMTGAWLLPGLSDSHVHLTSTSTDNGYQGLGVSLPRATISGVVNAGKTLRAGFTTVRNVGAGDGVRRRHRRSAKTRREGGHRRERGARFLRARAAWAANIS